MYIINKIINYNRFTINICHLFINLFMDLSSVSTGADAILSNDLSLHQTSFTSRSTNNGSYIGLTIGKYTCNSILGKGTYSRVYKCTENIIGGNISASSSTTSGAGALSTKPVAIKIYRSRNLDEFENEAAMLIYLKNCLIQSESDKKRQSDAQYILFYQDMFSFIYSNCKKFPDINIIPCVVFPLMYDNLNDVCDYLHAGFSLPTAKSIMKQILYGMNFIHSCNVIHTDLKPSNIVITTPSLYTTTNDNDTLKIKIVDFGTAMCDDDIYRSTIGTNGYCSPECLIRIGFSFPTDIWSFGCMVFELITGTKLFRASRKKKEKVSKIDVIKVTSSMLKSELSLIETCNDNSDKSGDSSEYYSSDDDVSSFDYSYSDSDYSYSNSKSDSSHIKSQEMDEVYQSLILYEQFLGRMPKSMIKRKTNNNYYNKHNVLKDNPVIESKSIHQILETYYDVNSDEAKSIDEFIKYILIYEPNSRPSIDKIINHKFLN